jgi:hypothetical protein
MEAPQGAVFICANRSAINYTRELAFELHRRDLRIENPDWLTKEIWRGQTLTCIIIDHSVLLARGEEIALYRALAAVRTPVFVATQGVSQAAQQFYGDPF